MELFLLNLRDLNLLPHSRSLARARGSRFPPLHHGTIEGFHHSTVPSISLGRTKSSLCPYTDTVLWHVAAQADAPAAGRTLYTHQKTKSQRQELLDFIWSKISRRMVFVSFRYFVSMSSLQFISSSLPHVPLASIQSSIISASCSQVSLGCLHRSLVSPCSGTGEYQCGQTNWNATAPADVRTTLSR